jgi:hypothetical protein
MPQARPNLLALAQLLFKKVECNEVFEHLRVSLTLCIPLRFGSPFRQRFLTARRSEYNNALLEQTLSL